MRFIPARYLQQTTSKAAQQTLCGLCAGIRLRARGSLALSAQSNLLLNATYQIVQAEWLNQA